MKHLPALFFLIISGHLFAQSPVAGPGLTAVYDPVKNIVKLKWQQYDADITKFILQRSADNSTWADIATLNITKENKGKFVKFADEKVGAGKNYYRLKTYTAVNVYQYSASIMVIIGKAGESNWLMYPVPVTTMLNLQYNGTALIPGVITVLVQGLANGQIFVRQRLASTTRLIQIPVGNLGRGIYDVRIYIQDKVVWNQRFAK